MAPRLYLSPDLSVPAADAVTQVYAVLARRGAGKTYVSMKLAEELLGAGAQVVVLDPVGVWWGLRLAADGAGPGLPVPVVGGVHGDIPLEPTGGALLADFVVDTGTALVLDLSEFTLGEQRRFVTAFATRLLERKKRAKSPLLLILEEAQEFVPQFCTAEGTQMLGALQRIIKLGRNWGIGAVLVSQRPQAVSKEVLSQAEVLLVGQLTGVAERAAVKAWVQEKGELAGTSLDQILPSQKQGQFYLWSPQWLGLARQVQIGARRTFDASSTPRLGELQEMRTLAKVDLGALSVSMQETIERAAQNDPTVLHKRLAAVIAERDELLGQRAQQMDPSIILALEPALHQVGDAVHQVLVQVQRLRAASVPTQGVSARPAPPRPVPPRAAAESQESTRSAPRDGDPVIVPVLKGSRRILWALASRRPAALSRAQLATLAGFAPDSGTFSNYLSELRGQGLLADQGRLFTVTQAGVQHLGLDCPSRPANTCEIIMMWKPKLTGAAKKMLEVLVQVYPVGVSREALAQQADLSATSGTFTNYLSILRVNGLVEDAGARGTRLVRASPTLFPHLAETAVN